MDGRWIFIVRGRPATREMDLWRISPDGGKAEQLTHLNIDIEHPTLVDERTVLFVAHNEYGRVHGCGHSTRRPEFPAA